ncbi:ricin B lectin [Sporormia fimetaria CBS 119925]|uniref:Ricin B lectin n=1 Tax=Sporormia fimetaria CBS 119925 TaxID=1340428 RepID=A0A6A6UXV7_9PLEO|nr:ricin B lectin [Sporormia fimetaria CBS 119925]
MKLSALLIALATSASTVSGALTWTLQRSPNPTPDQQDAYARIERAMTLAVSRYHRLSNPSKSIRVYYAPGVPTAEASYNGDLRFGSNRSYMTERTAMHEIAHTLGVGQTAAFDRKCQAGDWATALPLLRSWDGQQAKISCGGGHFWPYGLNYENEWSEGNADRHVLLVQAMLRDGM